MARAASQFARLFVGALALMSAVYGGSARGQSPDQRRTDCTNHQIDACTAIIESGHETALNLADAFYHRGVAYNFGPQRDLAHAIADFTQAIALNPSYGALVYRGFDYAEQHDYTRAIADYNQAIALAPQFSPAFFNRGNAYYAQRDYARAVADYDQAIRLNPQFADAFSNRGMAYRAQGDNARAIADYDQAGMLDATNAVYQNQRCWARAVASRELEVARAACDAALRITPNDAGSLDSRGLVGLKQQRWQDAWNDYDAAARADGTSAHYRFGRGVAALRLGRVSEGQADIAAAIALDANIAQTYADYGVTP